MNSFLLLCDLSSLVFWKKLKTPKSHFEIIWPLGWRIKMTLLLALNPWGCNKWMDPTFQDLEYQVTKMHFHLCCRCRFNENISRFTKGASERFQSSGLFYFDIYSSALLTKAIRKINLLLAGKNLKRTKIFLFLTKGR